MHDAIAILLDRLERKPELSTGVIGWGSPVPSFGDLSRSFVATLGINPSNREFVDNSGEELTGTGRRFHTLQSLGIDSWKEANARHIQLIVNSCRAYFEGNPYDLWFKRLNNVIAGSGASYYDQFTPACHLDLVPYATIEKWSALEKSHKTKLIEESCDILGRLLRDSRVELLILNGRSVVDSFEMLMEAKLERSEMPEWSLPRSSGNLVTGIAYSGAISCIAGFDLCRDIQVVGFNHNIQSSYGVTTEVCDSIKNWIANETAWRSW